MFRTVKAATAASVLATSLPLLTETVEAQTYGWNLVTPVQCQTINLPNSSGQMQTGLHIYTGGGYSIEVFESEVISTIAKSCDEGKSFYGWYVPGQLYWTDFYFYPPATETGGPLTAGWNLVRPIYCTTEQAYPDPSGLPQPLTTLWVSTAYFTFGVYESRAIAAIAKICSDGGAFYGYANGTLWNNFVYYPGL